MDLLIVFDRSAGGTRRVAEALARVAGAGGAEVRLATTATATTADVAAARAVLVGCSVKVRVPFGGERPQRMAQWIGAVDELAGKPAGAFCSYVFYPVFFADAVARTAETLQRLSAALEAKGADVVATRSFHRRTPGRGAEEFIGSVLEALPA